MPLPKESTYTIDDIYALPDGERAELIDGHIYYMAPPSTRHQRISSFISWKISEYIHTNQGTCEVFAAPFAVHLDETNNTYVEPDISVICDPNKLNDKGCISSPDWIIEIVSPASKRMDYYTKLFKYRTAGVREYWIVDPDKDRIFVYHFVAESAEEESMEEYTLKDSVKAGIYDELVIDFGDMDAE